MSSGIYAAIAAAFFMLYMSSSRTGRDIFIGCVLAIATMLLIAWLITPHKAHAAEVEPFIQYDHTSDIRRGPPLNDRDEWSLDHIGAGVTITAGKHRAWEMDLSHGYRHVSPTARWETSTKFTVRFYPRRLK